MPTGENLKKFLIHTLLCLNFLFASNLSTLDAVHSKISQETEHFLHGIDIYIANFLDNISNSSLEHNSYNNSDSYTMDVLFQNEKFRNETKDSFLLFSNDYTLNSLEKSEFNTAIRGKIALNESNERTKLFFMGKNKSQHLNHGDEKPEIGISYLSHIRDDLDIQYSLGLRSFNPHIGTRLSYTHKTTNWIITPEQYVEYSIKDEFKERTTLYLDKARPNNALFRLRLERSTESKNRGMSYNGTIYYFLTPKENTGIYFMQGFYGNTSYKNSENRYFRSINNYLTAISFRQNIFKKWFFYEISPAINFAEANDFEANYSLYLRFDIFFGKDILKNN